MVENLLLVIAGVILGLGLASALGSWSTGLLTDYLPYAPKGNLVLILTDVSLSVALGALGLAVLATIPPLLRLRRYSDLSAMRGS